MQPSAPPPHELHKRRTQPDDQELDPVVQQLGQDCGSLYAKLEVGEACVIALSSVGCF